MIGPDVAWSCSILPNFIALPAGINTFSHSLLPAHQLFAAFRALMHFIFLFDRLLSPHHLPLQLTSPPPYRNEQEQGLNSTVLLIAAFTTRCWTYCCYLHSPTPIIQPPIKCSRAYVDVWQLRFLLDNYLIPLKPFLFVFTDWHPAKMLVNAVAYFLT